MIYQKQLEGGNQKERRGIEGGLKNFVKKK